MSVVERRTAGEGSSPAAGDSASDRTLSVVGENSAATATRQLLIFQAAAFQDSVRVLALAVNPSIVLLRP